jgi:hypothetical protein
MIPVVVNGFAPYAAPASRPRGTTGDFAAALPSRPAAQGGAAGAATQAQAASSLLFVQVDGVEEREPRRRRTPREAARRSLDLLRGLQRALLGGDGASPADLSAAAEEAEALGDAAADAETRRLCAAVALRLRVELAKLDRAV